MSHIGPRAQPSFATKLESVKTKLDPRTPMATPLNILNLSIGEFDDLLNEFIDLFNNCDLNHYSKVSSQVDIAWLYMALSLYVHHWANDASGALQERAPKLEHIKKADQAFSIFLQNTCANFNGSSLRFINQLPKHVHQKLLHINANTFLFIGHLRHNENIDLNPLLASGPLFLSQHKLKFSSQAACAARPPSTQSMAEASVNQMLHNNLQYAPMPFRPIKLTSGDLFIEPKSGLELDFPLNSNITLETDGAHIGHFTQAGHHSIVHNLKAFSLRESGWTRIGIPVRLDNSDLVKSITNLMYLPPLFEFSNRYQFLMTLSEQIRNEIILKQQELLDINSGRFPQEACDEKRQQIYRLLELDSNIRYFVQRRSLEVLLRGANSPLAKNLVRSHELQVGNQVNVNELKAQRMQLEAEISIKLSEVNRKRAELEESKKPCADVYRERERERQRFVTYTEKLHTQKMSDSEREETKKFLHKLANCIEELSYKLRPFDQGNSRLNAMIDFDLRGVSFDNKNLAVLNSKIQTLEEEISKNKAETNGVLYSKLRFDELNCIIGHVSKEFDLIKESGLNHVPFCDIPSDYHFERMSSSSSSSSNASDDSPSILFGYTSSSSSSAPEKHWLDRDVSVGRAQKLRRVTKAFGVSA